MKENIVIANLGTGNLHSVRKALEHVSHGRAVSVTADPDEIRGAGHLVLPGQGAIGTWLAQLQSNPDLKSAIIQRLGDGPCLGICLGLQALFDFSEENDGCQGLGLLAGSVRHFSAHPDPDSDQTANALDRSDDLKIPHMGWNQVKQYHEHPLWHGIENQARFYFVHSYFADSTNSDEIMGQCHYGRWFTAAAARGNVFATQFHPEKSHRTGLQLLTNFVNWNGDQ